MEQLLRTLACASILALGSTACSVLAVADAAVSVAGTAVSIGATVVETTVDVAASGVKAAVGSSETTDEEGATK